MRIIDIIPLTRIPLAQPQILSYFSGRDLPKGAIVEIPLGRRQEIGVVFDSHEAADLKMEIKKAGYELRPLNKIISNQPILTRQQIELALWLGQYYFCSPGIFAKMMTPKEVRSYKLRVISYKPKSQKLILVPTISLAEKVAAHEKGAALWHSELTKKQQSEIWWKVRNGQTKKIIGTRSAVFLPFVNLKEIIIEDETNPAHRSWDMFPHYRAHEAAQKLAEIFGAKLILKNEAPSVESWHLLPPFVKEGRGGFSDKVNSINPPSPLFTKGGGAKLVDMRAELKNGNFSILSVTLQQAMKDALAQKKQVILFVNRRGAANFVLCRDCGYVAKCKNCEAPLAYHLINGRPIMFCHRCGYKETPPTLCPQCQGYRIRTVGIGTQKVELEAKKLFPKAEVLRLDSDTAPSQKEQRKIIDAFLKKETNLLIATQIILSWQSEIKSAAPGAVGLISADTLLHLPDFQSGERTFQTITRLKNLFPGSFIIQTYSPESSAIKYAATDDWRSFYDEEIEARQLLNYPPFSQIAKLTFRHRDPNKTGSEAKILAAKLKRATGLSLLLKDKGSIQISDALPAFIPKEKGKYIWNIIIKFKIPDAETKMSKEFLRRRNSLLQYVPSNWEINVDPNDLL